MHYRLSTPGPVSAHHARNQAALAGAIGLSAAHILYVGYGLTFELVAMPSLVVAGAPRMTYGQQWFALTGIAGTLGTAGGVSVALAWQRRWLWSAGLAAGACLLTSLVIVLLCADDQAHWPNDPSAYVLYWPFTVLVPAVFGVWLITFIASAAGRVS